MENTGQPISDSVNIGKRVEHYRTQKKISQDELAAILDISQQAISDIERGKTEIRVSQLLKIANALNISPEQLYSDERTMGIDARNSTNTHSVLNSMISGVININSPESLQALLVEKQKIIDELLLLASLQNKNIENISKKSI